MKGFIVVGLLLIANLAQSQNVVGTGDSILMKEDQNQVIDSVICYGKTFMGLRYKYGGTSPKGFDCSGFIQYIFNKYGLVLPHDSRAYANFGEKIDSADVQEIKKGDILLFKGSNLKSKRIGHISLVIEVKENEILMIHSCRRGVVIDNYLDSAYYLKRFAGVRRISGGN